MTGPLEMNFLDSLCSVPWIVATKTYGNSHATLIGLLVSWWITAAPDKRTALESGPSFGYHPKGKGGGLCDALLCEYNRVVGVLEVEGTRGADTAAKLGKFFAAELAACRRGKFYPSKAANNQILLM